MKIKTSELIGEALNYAVAIIEYGPSRTFINPTVKRRGIWVIPQKNGGKNHFHPSKSWAQGGALIYRMASSDGFRLEERPDTHPLAEVYYDQMRGEYRFSASGPTPLIAAMRCYVASKLGDEVEVPDELA